MNLPEQFLKEHAALQERITRFEQTLEKKPAEVPPLFAVLQKDLSAHLKRKDLFYARLDDHHRVSDRVLMHDLRNNHAAVVFSLESLAIRLRKNGPNDEWKKKWSAMTGVLIPHWALEQQNLFPLYQELLSAAEQKQLADDLELLK